MRRAIPFCLLAGCFLSLTGCGGGWTSSSMGAYAIRRPKDDENPPPAPPAPKQPAENQEPPEPPPPPKPDKVDAVPTPPPAAIAKEDPVEPPAATETSVPETPPDLAPRAHSIHNLKQIGAALEKYAQAQGNYPPMARFDATGRNRLLSWRVLLLPYLGYEELYDKFNLNQPWDSPQNKALLSQIPDVYRSPERGDEKTNYLVPVGNSAAFTPIILETVNQRGRSPRFEDGPENTIILLEASDDLSVPWTKPEDFNADTDNLPRMLGKARPDGMFVVWGGGRVGLLPVGLDGRTARMFLTIDAGDNTVLAEQVSFAPSPEAPAATTSADSGTPVASSDAPPPNGLSPVDGAGVNPLAPIGGAAPDSTGAVGATPPPKIPAAPGTTTITGAPSDSVAPRQPIPPLVKQQEAALLLNQVYGERLEAARTRDQKQAVAKGLLGELPKLQEDPAGQYVLLEKVRKMAMETGDVATSLQAVELLDTRFEVDATAMRVDALSEYAAAAAAQNTDATGIVLKYASELVRQALVEDNFDAAVKMYEVAVTAARRSKNGNLVRSLQSARQEIDVARRAYQEVEEVLDQLGTNPYDPAANQVVGNYYCFVKGDWAKGLPLLARGEDDHLRNLAERELDPPALVGAQVELGDAWWTLGEKQEMPHQRRMQLRGLYWYHIALPQLPEGLQKVKVEVRLKEAQRTYGAAAATPPQRGSTTP